MANASVLWVNSTAMLESMGDYDIALCKSTDSSADKFHANLNVPYAEGKPCGLFYEIDYGTLPFDSISALSGIEPTSVPDYNKIVAAIQSNGKNRAVHFVMIDVTKSMTPKLDADWLMQYGSWLMDAVYKKVKLPVYIYMTPACINRYSGNDLVALQTWLINSAQCISSYQAVPYEDSSQLPVFIMLTNSIGGGFLEGYYNGTVEQFDAEVGYTLRDSSTGDSGDSGDSGSSGDSGGSSETPITGDLTKIEAYLKYLAEFFGYGK